MSARIQALEASARSSHVQSTTLSQTPRALDVLVEIHAAFIESRTGGKDALGAVFDMWRLHRARSVCDFFTQTKTTVVRTLQSKSQWLEQRGIQLSGYTHC